MSLQVVSMASEPTPGFRTLAHNQGQGVAWIDNVASAASFRRITKAEKDGIQKRLEKWLPTRSRRGKLRETRWQNLLRHALLLEGALAGCPYNKASSTRRAR